MRPVAARVAARLREERERQRVSQEAVAFAAKAERSSHVVPQIFSHLAMTHPRRSSRASSCSSCDPNSDARSACDSAAADLRNTSLSAASPRIRRAARHSWIARACGHDSSHSTGPRRATARAWTTISSCHADIWCASSKASAEPVRCATDKYRCTISPFRRLACVYGLERYRTECSVRT